jgi:hypothetical protein
LSEKEVAKYPERSARLITLTVHPHLTVLLWHLDGTYWFQDELSLEAVWMTSYVSIKHVNYMLPLEERE